MNTFNRGQDNRFLETPFVIRDTSPEGQFMFGTTDNFAGGILFKKDNFSLPLNDAEQELNETEDNSELPGGVKQ